MMRYVLFICMMFNLSCALSLQEAKHLMGRTSFGMTLEDYERLKPLSKREAIEWLIASSQKNTHVLLPSWVKEPLYSQKRPKEMNAQEREAYNKEMKRRVMELKQWWLAIMLESPTPFLETMTLFWHNTFTSSVQKVRSPSLMAKQNEVLRQYALGNYGKLLDVMSHDAAMIRYLDAGANKKGSPNENYAREVMELFTLGEGHYSEKDVKETARAFSGWVFNPKKEKVMLVKKRHDDGEKTILGHTGYFDSKDVVQLLLQEEQTARFITTKAYKAFINENVDTQTIEEVAKAFRESRYESSVLMRELLLSDAFWKKENRGILVKSPLDLLIGTLRSLELRPQEMKGVVQMSRKLGQDVFNPPNVKGWKGGVAWLDTNTLMQREQILSRFTRVKEMKRGGMMMEMGDLSALSYKELEAFFLSMPPVGVVDESEQTTTLIRHLVLDPVYQLK